MNDLIEVLQAVALRSDNLPNTERETLEIKSVCLLKIINGIRASLGVNPIPPHYLK